MFLMLFAYAALILIMLKWGRQIPSAPFILANAYVLFLALPSALVYYSLFFNGTDIEYNQYYIKPYGYELIFMFLVFGLCVAYIGYIYGFNYEIKRPRKTLILIDAKSVALTIGACLSISFSAAFFLYINSAFGFAYFFEPRKLYEASRDGYVAHYTSLGLCLRLATLLVLFSCIRSRVWLITILFVISVLSGAKVNTYSIVMILFFYLLVFKWDGSFNKNHLLMFGVSAPLLIYLLGLITFHHSYNDITLLIVAYINEPLNNFNLLVQNFDNDFNDFFYGELSAENNVISRMPRILFPEKPDVFGGFKLAYQYFPESVALGKGAPSFGSEGVAYADFGVYGLAFLVFLKWIVSWILGRLTFILVEAKVDIKNRLFLYFGLLLVISDICFLNLPPANLFLENVILVVVLALIFGASRKIILNQPSN